MDKYDLVRWKRLLVMYSELLYEICILKKIMKNNPQNIEPEEFESQFDLEHKLLDVEELFIEMEELLLLNYQMMIKLD